MAKFSELRARMPSLIIPIDGIVTALNQNPSLTQTETLKVETSASKF